MTLLNDLTTALVDGRISLVDLTAPLSKETPIIKLPEPWANTVAFELEEISHFDERGPDWYWNNIRTGEHTGTHFDAPNHWISGRDGEDVSQVPLQRLIGPAVVLDFSEQVAQNSDFLLEIAHVLAWEEVNGPIPDGSWVLYRTGWDARSSDQRQFLNADESGPHTPGVSVECARWLADDARIVGLGTETVGTDAGASHSFDPPFPCHDYLLGSGKYGITQLQNLADLPPIGAVVVISPLPIVGGSGSPCRVIALVPGTGQDRLSVSLTFDQIRPIVG